MAKSLYRRDLENLLAKNAAPRVILLSGEDEFQIEYFGAKLAKKAQENGAEINKLYFFDKFDEPQNAVGLFSGGSLFGDEPCVLAKMDKLDKKDATKNAFKAISAAISRQNSGYFILEFYAGNKSPSDYSRDATTLSGLLGAQWCRFYHPKPQEALILLRQKANDLGLQIGDFVLRRILEQQNFELNKASGELLKYTILGREISLDDVALMGFGLGLIEPEEIFNALLARRDFMPQFVRFCERGFNESNLIREADKFFFQLFCIRAYAKLNGNTDPQEILGYKPPSDVWAQKAQMAMNASEEQYGKIFLALNSWRIDSFSGLNSGLSHDNGFLRFLIKIKEILG